MTFPLQMPLLLSSDLTFPAVDCALEDPDGLLAIGGDLSRERLILAYRNGIFPWFSEPEPILWWSPNPRAVLYLDQLKVSRSLGKSLRNRNFEVWLNKDFNAVLSHCASSRDYAEGTWITDGMQQAYSDLHDCGLAHCISVYQDKELVGGLYGLSQGKFFFGESMFNRSTDASKVALFYLVQYLAEQNFLMIDCQVPNSHLESLGSSLIPRDSFIELLEKWRDWSQPESMWQMQELSNDFCTDTLSTSNIKNKN